eukprot:TRINITY_DN2572_c0_g2_i2.p1 TRINITY_DN2572_c0_g2~~TRINITY_DN2572_c0_g2_i2.p1  ORF type:complete len:462 (+),score=79.67 TRINITY_DN2572_c0_g2_i2:173-1387(+)
MVSCMTLDDFCSLMLVCKDLYLLTYHNDLWMHWYTREMGEWKDFSDMGAQLQWKDVLHTAYRNQTKKRAIRVPSERYDAPPKTKWPEVLEQIKRPMGSDTLMHSRDLFKLACDGVPEGLREHVWLSVALCHIRQRRYNVMSDREFKRKSVVPHRTQKDQYNKDLSRATLVMRTLTEVDGIDVAGDMRLILQAFLDKYPATYTGGGCYLVQMVYLYSRSPWHACILMHHMHLLPGVGRFTSNPDMEMFEACSVAFARLMDRFLPKIDAHFQASQITSSFFLYAWLRLAFVITLPPRVLSRVWDIFLCCPWLGMKGLLLASIALLEQLESEIVGLDFEGIINTLRNDVIQQRHGMDPDAFVACMRRVHQSGPFVTICRDHPLLDESPLSILTQKQLDFIAKMERDG